MTISSRSAANGGSSIPLVDLRAQLRDVGVECRAAMDAVLADCGFILGEHVKAFERAFAAYCGVRYCVGVGNGTDALEMTLNALEVGPGHEVLVPVNSFVATAEAVANVGARPVLVEMHPQTWCLDIDDARSRITERTRAIIPVHLYGRSAAMDGVLDLARAHELAVIEDAAQAQGGFHRGRRVGALGHAAAFSFYAGKNLGAFGDAGAVTTDDDGIAERIQRLRDHGSLQKYDHEVVGRNSRLDGIQAAVLTVKLRHLDRWNARRQEHAETYRTLLEGVPGLELPDGADGLHVYHLFVIRVPRAVRDDLRRHLANVGVQSGVHYPVPIHLTGAFRYLGLEPGAFPVSEDHAARVLSLPMFPELEREQLERIASEIRGYLERSGR